ncbi:MAG: hypothetical protein JNJ54_31455 [Myxococcaceae bacterium]|nr:hypothetical protein [Myxococcaceae bacterium]
MSRSFKNNRWKAPSMWRPNKRARHAVHEVLKLESLALADEWLEVLADVREERGLSLQARVLRRGADLVLPVAPHGFNSRLRR